jgi:hypothetical protein
MPVLDLTAIRRLPSILFLHPFDEAIPDKDHPPAHLEIMIPPVEAAGRDDIIKPLRGKPKVGGSVFD